MKYRRCIAGREILTYVSQINFTGNILAMQLFKSKPSLTDGEKARIELHLQQIAESIGADRLRLDVLTEEQLLYRDAESSTLEDVKSLAVKIGQHLSHDVGNIAIREQPQTLEKCGGGG